MGTDKGLLRNDDKTWAELAYHKLAALEMPVFLSVNEIQYQQYQLVFKKAILVVDTYSVELGRPLHGLLSFHFTTP